MGRSTAEGWLVRFALSVAMALVWLIAGDGYAESEAPGTHRDRLTAAELLDDTGEPGSVLDNGWFMPVGTSGPAHHTFSGTLILSETHLRGFDGDDPTDAWFPEVEISFLSHGDSLIPADSGFIRGTGEKSPWDIIVSPGRIWSEPSDNGLSRASFPFVLSGGAWWNEAHNGLATFVFDGETVSDIAVQIVQETAPDNQFDAFGRIETRFRSHAIVGRESIVAAFERERATRLPVVAFGELDNELSLDALRAFAGKWSDGPVSASGLIVDGVIYLRPCETRHGDFPYCEDMRHGVFSVTKSLGALIAMLRLAERYGDQIFDLRIKDYVRVTADHDGWEDVTFADALNMATGIGEASDKRAGGTFWAETYPGARTDSFMHATSAADKLDAAFSAPAYDWGPGEVFRYRNMDTFVLAAAMDGLVKRREGPEADLGDVITAEVLEPIGVMALPLARTAEADGGPGIPILVSGAYPTVHDIAKIATLLQNEGRYGGEQILSAAKLADALYQTEKRGLEVAGRAGETYHMSFWYFPTTQRGCTVDAPRMDGWGGNLVELLPNDTIAFYLSDDFAYGYRGLAEAIGEVRSLCPH